MFLDKSYGVPDGYDPTSFVESEKGTVTFSFFLLTGYVSVPYAIKKLIETIRLYQAYFIKFDKTFSILDRNDLFMSSCQFR